MHNHGKVITLIILNIIVLLLSAVELSNFSSAQENLKLHQKTLYYFYENHTTSNAGITVGYHPSATYVNEYTHKIYVANAGDNTLSVIDGTTNTVIGRPIPVGSYPLGIAEGSSGIYVANGGGAVSLINETTHTVIRTFGGGGLDHPSGIGHINYMSLGHN